MFCADVEDDRSPVYMTFCVGTYTGGCDVIKDRELSGTTTVTEVASVHSEISYKLPLNIFYLFPLFFKLSTWEFYKCKLLLFYT